MLGCNVVDVRLGIRYHVLSSYLS